MQCQRTAFLLNVHDILKQKIAQLHYHNGQIFINEH